MKRGLQKSRRVDSGHFVFSCGFRRGCVESKTFMNGRLFSHILDFIFVRKRVQGSGVLIQKGGHRMAFSTFGSRPLLGGVLNRVSGRDSAGMERNVTKVAYNTIRHGWIRKWKSAIRFHNRPCPVYAFTDENGSESSAFLWILELESHLKEHHFRTKVTQESVRVTFGSGCHPF